MEGSRDADETRLGDTMLEEAQSLALAQDAAQSGTVERPFDARRLQMAQTSSRW